MAWRDTLGANLLLNGLELSPTTVACWKRRFSPGSMHGRTPADRTMAQGERRILEIPRRPRPSSHKGTLGCSWPQVMVISKTI